MKTRNICVSDLGCVITGVIEGSRIRIVDDGACGPDCLGMTIPSGLSDSGIEDVLAARFARKASRNMGTKYDPDINGLRVTVTR